MTKVLQWIGGAVLAVALAGCGGGGGRIEDGRASEDGPFRVLVFSKTAGFRHLSIESGIAAIQQLGADNGFEVDATEDASMFTADNLAQYAAVIWLSTTLDVLDEEQQQVFEAYIADGGGYVGIHSAADTEYDWPFYGELVGAYFLAHPVANQPGTLRVESPDQPATAHLGESWSLPLEEYYSFRSNPRGSVRVLLTIDEDSYRQTPNTSCDPSGPTFPEGYSAHMGDHPMSWCHDKFAGRAWYTALGHEIYLYQDADFLAHILGGILTAARRIEADCTPADGVDAPAYEPAVLESCESQLAG